MSHSGEKRAFAPKAETALRVTLWLVAVFFFACGTPRQSQNSAASAECSNVRCAAGEVCSLGVCHVGCSGGGWTMCSGQCVDTSVDDTNCGTCGGQCTGGKVCSESKCLSAALVPRPRLIVSLTADDTLMDQFTTMAPLLESNGLRATFFINSSRIDLPGGEFMSTAQIQELQTVGHEIGAHGLMHLHLIETITPPDRIKREICDSRVDLLARGFQIRNFAFPFGLNDLPSGELTDAFTESLIGQCGYLTGRGVGNLDTKNGVFSETIPPADPHMLRAGSSINSTVTLQQVQQRVLDAENNQNAADPNPPWLIINFHHLCPGAACDPMLAWDNGLYGQFVSWLAARKPQGTVVRTISQVVTGPVNPPVPSGTPLVINGDLESYLAGATAPPDCWKQESSKGTNTAVWTQVAGRTGFGQQLGMSNWVSGSHTLLQDRGTHTVPDYKSCGTPVVPGHSYTFTCWYQSDVSVALAFYENDTVTHTVNKWITSAVSPPASTWTSISHTVTIPADFNTVFFGPYIAKVCSTGCVNGPNTATLIVDDCSALDNG